MVWPTLNFIVDKTCWNILQNIFFGVLQEKQTPTGLQRHEGVNDNRSFIFAWIIPLRIKNYRLHLQENATYIISHTDVLLKPSHNRQLLGATRILKVMSLELWCQTSAGLYVPVGMYGLLPVNRPGHNSIKVQETRNNEKRVSFLFISGREAIFHSEEQIEQHFIHREENKWSQAWLFTVSLAGYVSAVPEAAVPLLVRVCEVCLNLSLTDAIFIILVYGSRNRHITPDHRYKNKAIFFLEKTSSSEFIVIKYSKQHCSSHAGKSTCAFSSEYPFICSLFHASISQITCICLIICLFN